MYTFYCFKNYNLCSDLANGLTKNIVSINPQKYYIKTVIVNNNKISRVKNPDQKLFYLSSHVYTLLNP